MKSSSMLYAAMGLATLALCGSSAIADGKKHRQEIIRAELQGIREVPSLSTPASGHFRAVIDEDSGMITWSLSYEGLVAAVQQAHIHFGQRSVNGGVSAFLCTNLNNGPAGTQACPAPPAEITGIIMAADIVGPAGQGIAAGEFAELVAAIRQGVAYANVHSATYQAGEIRGQIFESFR